MAFKLSKELADKIKDVHLSLESELADLRGEFDAMSDRWQDSEKADDVIGWLERLDDMVDVLDTFRSEDLAS